MLEFMYDWLLSLGVEPEMAKNWTAPLLVGLCILALSVIADFIVKRIALRTLKYVIEKTTTPWDDAFVEHRVLDRLAHLAPAVVIYLLADLPFTGMTEANRDYCGSDCSGRRTDFCRSHQHLGGCGISQCRAICLSDI